MKSARADKWWRARGSSQALGDWHRIHIVEFGRRRMGIKQGRTLRPSPNRRGETVIEITEVAPCDK